MSEFRKDIVSGDWIIMAPERAKRPKDFLSTKTKRIPTPKESCPFEDLQKSGNWPPILSYPNIKDWQVVIIPNKYPALAHLEACAQEFPVGPYIASGGIGHHDLLLTRDHEKNVEFQTREQAVRVFQILQQRYLQLADDPCMVYTSMFFNWGPKAGASLFHPHYQILSLPIVPPDVAHSLEGSKNYFKTHRRCVHCTMIEFEQKQKIRVVAANRHAIAFAPFVSRSALEVRVFPRVHYPSFEHTPRAALAGVVDVLRMVMGKMTNRLNDPDRNFFIHTAPLKHQNRFDYYHWHIEVIPKFGSPGGFELSTGIEINVISPEHCAAMLNGKES